jgi:hypothetical protein
MVSVLPSQMLLRACRVIQQIHRHKELEMAGFAGRRARRLLDVFENLKPALGHDEKSLAQFVSLF